MRGIALALVWLAPAATVAQAPQAPQARALLEPDSVKIGEPFTLTITVSGVPSAARVVFPELSDTGPVTALGPPAVLPEQGGAVRSARYRLAAWQLGELPLPGGAVQVRDGQGQQEVVWPQLELHVTSVLPEGADPDTLTWRPPAEVVGPSWSLAERLIGAALALAVLVLLAVYARRRRGGGPVPAPPAAPPDDRALASLERLRGSGLLEAGELKAFFSVLSRIWRDYLAEIEPRWGPDLTTRELVAAAAGAGVGGSRLERLRHLLELTDRVKFARYRPSAAQAVASLDEVRSWVESFEWPRRFDARVGEGYAAPLAELDEIISSTSEGDGADPGKERPS